MNLRGQHLSNCVVKIWSCGLLDIADDVLKAVFGKDPWTAWLLHESVTLLAFAFTKCRKIQKNT